MWHYWSADTLVTLAMTWCLPIQLGCQELQLVGWITWVPYSRGSTLCKWLEWFDKEIKSAGKLNHNLFLFSIWTWHQLEVRYWHRQTSSFLRYSSPAPLGHILAWHLAGEVCKAHAMSKNTGPNLSPNTIEGTPPDKKRNWPRPLENHIWSSGHFCLRVLH